jgi:hypothetical protein
MLFDSEMSQNRKILSLIGGFIVHFVIGTTYTTGNLSVYFASYLRLHGDSVTLEQLNVLFPLQVTAATCTVLLGTYLVTKYNPRV